MNQKNSFGCKLPKIHQKIFERVAIFSPIEGSGAEKINGGRGIKKIPQTAGNPVFPGYDFMIPGIFCDWMQLLALLGVSYPDNYVDVNVYVYKLMLKLA